MSILIDLNQVMISGITTQISPNQQVDENLLLHIVLNTLRANIKKFKEYGEVILCCDSKTYWRKQVFPYYKAHRKHLRDKSKLDWNLIFKVLNKAKEDLKQNFPYKVIEVENAEADDIIGTLVPRLSQSSKVIIISSDADFKQLQRYSNVKQYNPMLNIYIKSKNPIQDLKEKVIRGDSGDGIPNILSSDNVFVEKIRQSPVSNKKLDSWLISNPKDVFSEEIYRNYIRNDTLINFDNIPIPLKENIINQYETLIPASKRQLLSYLVKNKLVSLIESIEDF